MNGTGEKYLRAGDVARLRGLRLLPSRRVGGVLSGAHASTAAGRSVEFTDYRRFGPGDDPAGIDWKVYARSDRLYLKRHEQEAMQTVGVLVDASASMGFEGVDSSGAALKGESKFDYAARLAAALGFVVIEGGDRLGWGLAREGLAGHGAAGRTQRTQRALRVMLDGLEGVRLSGELTGVAGLGGAIEQMSARLSGEAGGGGTLVVVSDLLDESDEGDEVSLALEAHRKRGGEAVVIQVLHRQEVELPNVGAASVVDSETGRELAVDVDELRVDCERRVRAFVEGWRERMTARGIGYRFAVCDEDPVEVLRGLLAARR